MFHLAQASATHACTHTHTHTHSLTKHTNYINVLLDKIAETNPATPYLPQILFLSKLEQFKKDNAAVGFGSGTLAVEQAIERTKANIVWISENKAQVLKWFRDDASNP